MDDLLKLALQYLQVLTWPLLIVGLLAVYRPPIKRIVASLASKLEAADSLSIGAFKLEVQRRVIEALMRTPRSGTMSLVFVNDTGARQDLPNRYGIPLQPELDGLLELEKKKLIAFSEPLDGFLSFLSSTGERQEKNPASDADDRTWYASDSDDLEKRCRAISYGLTESGVKAVDAISKAVAAQLADAEA